MGLVDYSDSEASETEAPKNETQRDAAKLAASDKPAFEKVVNSSNSGKIKVTLPALDSTNENQSQNSQADGEPPAKRARTAGTFSGFGSLLPAPKNANSLKSTGGGGSILAQNRGNTSGRINLKTSATPAFSRKQQQEEEDDYQYNAAVASTQQDSRSSLHNATGTEGNNGLTSTTIEDKPPAKPMMFKPLSVARKTVKKKQPTGSTEAKIGKSDVQSSADKSSSETTRSSTQKPKVSLFSASIEENSTFVPKHSSEYEPILGDGDDATDGDRQVDQYEATAAPSQIPDPPANDLGALANNLGLSASERRQLFGRSGQPTNAQVAEFNLAQEYKHNQELRENEESAPMHNPIKSIAPGKHSLQQLVSAAQTNRDALDESFARGKSNKKATGTKYGW